MSLTSEQPQSPQMDDAEAQMRRALGLYGDQPRMRLDPERQDGGQRHGGGAFLQGPHRRRFVQDGEVPVTVVRRDAPEAAGAQAGPSTSRLQRVEAALQQESAARDRAERALSDAQAAAQALRTKIGHAELAKNEAVEAARRDRDELITLREQIASDAGQLRAFESRAREAEDELRSVRAALHDERRGRSIAGRTIHETSATADLDDAPDVVLVRRPYGLEPERIPARRGRPPLARVEADENEPEPVKWWLAAPKTAVIKRR